MTKFKHSKGPWIKKNSNHVWQEKFEVKPGVIIPYPICECFSKEALNDEENNANICLISAAPEMLEALIDTYNAFKDTPFLEQTYFMRIKHSIEKATGLKIEEILK